MGVAVPLRLPQLPPSLFLQSSEKVEWVVYPDHLHPASRPLHTSFTGDKLPKTLPRSQLPPRLDLSGRIFVDLHLRY